MAIALLLPITVLAQGAGSTVTLANPIGEANIQSILGIALNTAFGIIGSITFLVFIAGGFMWLTSAGSSDKVKKGSQTMLYAALGIFIIFSSYAILATVISGLGAGTTPTVLPSAVGPVAGNCVCEDVGGLPVTDTGLNKTTCDEFNAKAAGSPVTVGTHELVSCAWVAAE